MPSVPRHNYWLGQLPPVAELAFCHCLTNLPSSATRYTPESEYRRNRIERSVLPAALRIDVRSMYADLTGKVINGFVDGQIN